MPEELNKLLAEHLRSHPAAQITDAVKFIFQNEFGGGHLIKDAPAVLARLKAEFISAAPFPALLFEPVGNGLGRLNLRPARGKIAPETLFKMFEYSARCVSGNIESFENKLTLLSGCGFDSAELCGFLQKYRAAGCPAVSHSDAYRAAYAPAYRIVKSEFSQFFQVFTTIDRHSRSRGPIVVAIDGRCASGKTTLSALLAQVYDANVFHADDYFLPPEMRTEERLNSPGGNMHRERLLSEILKPLSIDSPAVTRRFDCSSLTLLPPVIHPKKRINIVEGSYCQHPELRDYYTIRVMLTTSKETQLQRLAVRDPGRLSQFERRWIPLEERYFSAFHSIDAADIVIET